MKENHMDFSTRDTINYTVSIVLLLAAVELVGSGIALLVTPSIALHELFVGAWNIVALFIWTLIR